MFPIKDLPALDADRWRVISPHLDRALALEGEARDAVLNDLSATDPTLADELRALLGRLDRAEAERFLEINAPHDTLADMRPAMREGQVLGSYTLLSLLGEGGMGTVWLASRSDGLYASQVAVKLVRAAIASGGVVARFESERQLLARMNHPHIARVLDAGTATDGRPFFVMEYVDGPPLHEYCDARSLSVAERLALFLDVCAGVQHAHRNGIIHRDIKPSNILVANQDGRAVPKIIDFGVAKAIGPGFADATLTGPALRMGTPNYMSPEQWGAFAGIVDTRTDVYSLGVLCYELLAGVRPTQMPTGVAGPPQPPQPDDERDPPSVRFAGLGNARGTIASRRGTTPAALTRMLRGDVDWIVMKATAHEPDRRYESPASLAQDLRRHLEGLPVVAGPPDLRYRLVKFVRRHRVGVGLAGAAFVGLVAFTTATMWQSAQVARERDRANREATTANRTLQVITSLFELSDPSEARGRTVTAREILDRGAAKVEAEMKGEPIAQAKLLRTLGMVYYGLGLHDQAGTLLERSVELHQQSLGEGDPATQDAMTDLGVVRWSQGRLDEAEALLRALLAAQPDDDGDSGRRRRETANHLSLVLEALGRFDEAERYMREALAGFQRTVPLDQEGVLRAMNNLGNLLRAQGKNAEAEPYLREVVESCRRTFGNDHPNTLVAINNLGLVYQSLSRLQEAAALGDEVYETRLRIFGKDHPSLLRAAQNLGSLRLLEGQLDAAESLLVQASDGFRRVLGPEHRETLRASQLLGQILDDQHRFHEAEILLREALAVQRRTLGEDHPDAIATLISLARSLEGQRRFDEAEPVAREGLERSLRTMGPNRPSRISAASVAADIATSRGRADEAEAIAREALTAARSNLPPNHQMLGRIVRTYGHSLAALGRHTEAEATLLEAHRILTSSDRALALVAARDLAALYVAWGKPAQAAEWEHKAGS